MGSRWAARFCFVCLSCAKSEILREGERNKSYISMMKGANDEKSSSDMSTRIEGRLDSNRS